MGIRGSFDGFARFSRFNLLVEAARSGCINAFTIVVEDQREGTYTVAIGIGDHPINTYAIGVLIKNPVCSASDALVVVWSSASATIFVTRVALK